ncbi:MAG TPA: hypothetical protein VMK65_05335 [Longimicrobiales bacterium]|nr:hypothetical protein [Longimicrobiales bacterium]
MRYGLSLLAAAVLLVPAPAAAQVVWDSPMFAAPQPEAGYGFYLFEPAGADLGLLGTFKGAASRVRFRLGIADGAGTAGIAVLGGIDYSALLRSRDADFPLDIGWVIGTGFGYQDWLSISIPFGFSAGIPIQADDLRFTPFVTPRVVVDAFLDAPEGVDETNLDFAVDIGLDMGIGRTWGLRFAATLGGRDALGIGIVF